MSAYISRLCGEEWQRWANQLLICHYGPTEYQKVPDNDKGDAGIEGFTISEGHAYQAYGCEEPLSTTERYEKQRDKMTTDISKFINNRSALQKIFGTVRITRWALFVPYCDSKELIGHASKKTSEVLDKKLPYVGDTFRVVVCQEEDFCIARDQLINAGAKTLQVTADATTSVTDWISSNDSLAATLDDKLRKLPTLRNNEGRRRFHEAVLRWYLEGQQILEALRTYPDVYEKTLKAKSHRENFLVMATVSGSSPQEILTSSIQDLLETLQREVRELHRFSAEALAHEAVADWLLRCPLDFPEVVQNA
ncbi:MAG TPA: hypothetical protein VJ180_00240 [Pyrinomonadaceae bacterium]|nr:hypothetical protein [Pyrinomonadaceae bacterium]